MEDNTICLLVSFDRNYIKPFQVMLTSLVLNNPQERFHIWLLHSGILQSDLDALAEYCGAQGAALTPVLVEPSVFKAAPISKRYPQEMYYRLLAPVLLPDSVKRILYLDPDILVINPVRPLWEVELNGHAFAAAPHSVVPDMVNDVNRLRLGSDSAYFNTGVILMDLSAARALVKPEDIFHYVQEHAAELLLPDQDVFNCLYGSYTLHVEDTRWNYDARRFAAYHLSSSAKYDMDWVVQNTVFLHFCGKHKPWKSSSYGRFSAVYKHYMCLAERRTGPVGTE